MIHSLRCQAGRLADDLQQSPVDPAVNRVFEEYLRFPAGIGVGLGIVIDVEIDETGTNSNSS